MEVNGEKRLAFDYGRKKLDFSQVASTGTITLCHLFLWLSLLGRNYDYSVLSKRFIFIDEFDAFYHHAVSKLIVKELKKMNAQVILTTHNTSIMSNDLLRPDCYFIMSEADIKPMYRFTDKELRKAHNIEKMYKAGAFDA
jgi:AAA15 family ATPase/GTPase